MFKYLLLVLLIFSGALRSSAQLKWQSRGPLYEDINISIEIEYAMGSGTCATGEIPSQFRYHVTRLKKTGAFYIHWRFDYFDCDHQIKTRSNIMRVTSAIKTGYITPEDNEFSALKMVNYFNDVKRFARLPEVSAYYPTSTVSLEPKMITGKLSLKKGEATDLSIQGGYLAANDIWQWYEGSCNGKAAGTGVSLRVRPHETTTYSLRAQGRSTSTCISVTVTVVDMSEPATAISGPSIMCEGEKNTVLMVTGGHLTAGAKWVWYQNTCAGPPVGEGDHINVSPSTSTTYFVRAEGEHNTTLCREHRIIVSSSSKPAERVIGPESAAFGESFTLSVQGGELGNGAQWVWYSGNSRQENRLGTGGSITVVPPTANQTYFVRAESPCFQSAFTAKLIRLRKQLKPARVPSAGAYSKPSYFLNGGIESNASGQLKDNKNYVLTIGGGKNLGWFIRAKIAGDQSKSSYETAGAQITDYDQTGYYQDNNQTVSKRSGYTAGIYWGIKNIAVYVGGGYGSRSLFYRIDQYAYSSTYPTGSTWVKNTSYSYSGAEIEGGLILKTGIFNLMGGLSNVQGKYTDYNFGIGINF